jgi:hypothetical protein
MWLFFMLFGSPAGLLSLATTLTGRSPTETSAGRLPLA